MGLGPEGLAQQGQHASKVEPDRGSQMQWGGSDVDAAALQHAPNGIFDGLQEPGKPRAPDHQRFGSDEHQTYGNEGATKAGYTGTYSRPANGYVFELTQGDISLLAGDEFDPRTTDETKPPGKRTVAANLWAFANTP